MNIRVLLVVVALFMPNLAWAIPNIGEFPIYSYGFGEIISFVLERETNPSLSLFDSQLIQWAYSMVFALVIAIAILMTLIRGKMSLLLEVVIVTTIILSIGFGFKADAIIQDRTLMREYVVQDAPAMPVIILSLTTDIAYQLTKKIRAWWNYPTGYQDAYYNVDISSTILRDLRSFRLNDRRLVGAMNDLIADCVIKPYAYQHGVNIESFTNGDFWDSLRDTVSQRFSKNRPVTSKLIQRGSFYNVVTCADAHDAIIHQVNQMGLGRTLQTIGSPVAASTTHSVGWFTNTHNRALLSWNRGIDKTLLAHTNWDFRATTRTRIINNQVNTGSSSNPIITNFSIPGLSQAVASYMQELGAGQSQADTFLLNAIGANAFIEGEAHFRRKFEIEEAPDFINRNQALVAQKKSWEYAFIFFQQNIPYIIGILTIFLVIITPIIMVMLIIPNYGRKVTVGWLVAMGWCAAMPVAIEAVNGILFFMQQLEVRRLLGASIQGITALPVSLASIHALSEFGDRMASVSGFFMTCTSMIIYGLLKGGEWGLTGFFGSIAGGSSVDRAAQSAATGQIDMNNTRMNTLSANKYDTRWQSLAGMMGSERVVNPRHVTETEGFAGVGTRILASGQSVTQTYRQEMARQEERVSQLSTVIDRALNDSKAFSDSLGFTRSFVENEQGQFTKSYVTGFDTMEFLRAATDYKYTESQLRGFNEIFQKNLLEQIQKMDEDASIKGDKLQLSTKASVRASTGDIIPAIEASLEASHNDIIELQRQGKSATTESQTEGTGSSKAAQDESSAGTSQSDGVSSGQSAQQVEQTREIANYVQSAQQSDTSTLSKSFTETLSHIKTAKDATVLNQSLKDNLSQAIKTDYDIDITSEEFAEIVAERIAAEQFLRNRSKLVPSDIAERANQQAEQAQQEINAGEAAITGKGEDLGKTLDRNQNAAQAAIDNAKGKANTKKPT